MNSNLLILHLFFDLPSQSVLDYRGLAITVRTPRCVIIVPQGGGTYVFILF